MDGLATVHPELAGADDGLLRRAFGRTAFVHLRRDNTVAQAVSWLRAEQTNLWYVGCPDATGAEPRLRHRDGVEDLLRTIDAHQAAWEEWFAAYGVTPHRVRYEDLAADPAGVTREVLGFLGLDLPAGVVIRPRHRRQADALNAAVGGPAPRPGVTLPTSPSGAGVGAGHSALPGG